MKLNLAEKVLVNNPVRPLVQRFYEGPLLQNWEVGLTTHAFSTSDAAAVWECKYCWSSSEQGRSKKLRVLVTLLRLNAGRSTLSLGND